MYSFYILRIYTYIHKKYQKHQNMSSVKEHTEVVGVPMQARGRSSERRRGWDRESGVRERQFVHRPGWGDTVSNDHFCDYATGLILLAATSQKWHWQPQNTVLAETVKTVCVQYIMWIWDLWITQSESFRFPITYSSSNGVTSRQSSR